MKAENLNSLAHVDLWQQACTLYAQGRTARQIAHATGLAPSLIASRAVQEQWPAPPPPDWEGIREAWEGGKSDRALALQYGVSASTLRKRRQRENWSRSTARGIDALRLAVTALENALGQTDFGDTVATTRLAAALSMAAGRLRDAEKQLLGKTSGGNTADADYDFEGENTVMREQMMEQLVRLSETAGEEEGEGNDNKPITEEL